MEPRHQFTEYLHGRAASTTALALPAFTILLVVIFNAVQSYLRLRHVPGPCAAALTNLVRRSWVKTGEAQRIHTDLHRRYGTVVRIGPNAVSVSQPKAIDKIYGFKTRLTKSEMYDVIMPRINGHLISDVFGTRDNEFHRRLRRPVANLYSVTNVATFEPLIVSTIQLFFSRLDDLFTDKDVALNLFDWIQYFMFDVLSQLTFSQYLGCLEKGGDVENVIENNWLHFKTIAANTQMAWLDYLWRDNPLLPSWTKRNPLAEFGFARIQERMSLTEDEKQDVNQRDYLSCFIQENAKDPSLPELFVPLWVNTNIVAGADTTSILAGVLMYNLLKNPASLAKLREEIDGAAAAGRLSDIATWKETQDLPYLEACVNEASRMHPPFCLPFERVVPEEGLEIDGYFIAPGTRIGINPWVVQRDPELYGDDAEVWRPERWLCEEPKRTAMQNALMTFGAGHRGCIGKHLALFEIYKLIPSLLRRYQITLEDPAFDMPIENKWLLKPAGFRVKLATRR